MRTRPGLDVLYECTKLRHDLMPPRMIQKDAWRDGRKRIQDAQQLTFREEPRHDWFGQLRQPNAFNRGTEQGWKVVRNVRPIDGDLDRTTIVVERPIRDQTTRAAPSQTCVIA